MKYFKKFVKVLIWPILFGSGQFFIQYIFIYAFNINEIEKLKKSNSALTINELIKTDNYKLRLNEFINSKSLLIVLLMFIIFLPILYNVFKKYRTKNKLKYNNTIIIILLGVTISLIYNISIFNINSIFNFTNQFKLSELSLFIQIICSGFIGPILEEFVFRGIVYNRLKEFNTPMKSIVICSIIFALMHTNLVNMLYAFIISFILIYVYEKNKSLKAPIMLHIVLNITIVLFTPLLIINNIFINYSILFISLIILIFVYLKFLKKDVYLKK